MKFSHVAALALVTFYLIYPPTDGENILIHAPYMKWVSGGVSTTSMTARQQGGVLRSWTSSGLQAKRPLQLCRLLGSRIAFRLTIFARLF